MKGSNLMIYQVMLGFAITFIISGLILAILTVYIFFNKNMAEVYDSLLDRNYVEKLNKKSKANKNQAKYQVEEISNKVTNQVPKKNATEQSIKHSANSSINSAVQKSYNSGNTAYLGRNVGGNQFNNGNTALLNSQQGETAPLVNKKGSKGFVVTKDLTYTYTNETIQ